MFQEAIILVQLLSPFNRIFLYYTYFSLNNVRWTNGRLRCGLVNKRYYFLTNIQLNFLEHAQPTLKLLPKIRKHKGSRFHWHFVMYYYKPGAGSVVDSCEYKPADMYLMYGNQEDCYLLDKFKIFREYSASDC